MSDTLAPILEREPDWSALPAARRRVFALAQRCLEKDPRRLRDIGDARVELDEHVPRGELERGQSSRLEAPGPEVSDYLGWWSVAAVLLVALARLLLFWRVTGEAPVSLPVARTVIVLPPDQKLSFWIYVPIRWPCHATGPGSPMSPNGRARDAAHVRELSDLEADSDSRHVGGETSVLLA